MVESKAMQSIVYKAAIPAGTAMMMAIRDADAGPRSAANKSSIGGHQRQRHGGPALEKPAIGWNGQDK